jgi:hypothetical protein
MTSAATPQSTVQSWEIRWFLPHGAYDTITRRFDHSEYVDIQPWRSDAYALGTGPAVGVKLREGRLEIKRRLEAEVIDLSAARGVIERWVKESFAPDAAPRHYAPSTWAGSLTLHKCRRAMNFALATDGGIDPIEPNVRIEGAGCQVELTEIRLHTRDGEAAWTLGLESFGDESGQRAALLACVDALLRITSPSVRHVLDHHRSRGYPAWIDSLDVPRR